MDQIEIYADAQAAELTQPHKAQNKGRACVVAEKEQPLTLALGNSSAFIKSHSRPHTHGIAAHNADEKGGKAFARYAEKPA